MRLVFFNMERANAYWHKIMTTTHVYSLYKQNSPLSRLDFFFLPGGSCEDIARLSI